MKLSEIVDRINAQNVDVVFFTGDLLDAALQLKPEAMQPLQNLNAPIYFVDGNHDEYTGVKAINDYLRSIGCDYPINYRKEDFVAAVERELKGERLDAAFDSVGGKTYAKSRKLLGAAGRMVNFGAATRSSKAGGIFGVLKLVWDFGFIHPIGLIVKSQSTVGVNMLRVADYKPHIVQRCMEQVVAMTGRGELNPHVGGRYKASEIAEAHSFLESRKSIGKIVVEW